MGPQTLRQFSLAPQPDQVHEMRELLTRLSWYGAESLRIGSSIRLASSSVLNSALDLGPPFWVGAEAKAKYESLDKSIVSDASNTMPEARIQWRSTGHTHSNGADEGEWYLSPWAQIDGEQRWVAFAEAFSPARAPNTRADLSRALGASRFEKATLVGPGPSIATLETPHSNEVVIMTLSALLNQGQTSKVRPDIVIFADALAIIGPSSVAEENRRALISAAQSGAMLVTLSKIAQILASQLPDSLGKNLLGLPVSDIDFLESTQRLTEGALPRTNNVLTMLGLPLAAGLSDSIRLVGFDGVVGTNKTFEHRQNGDQLRRVSVLRAAHPGIGLPPTYYDTHRAITKKMITSLGKVGVRVTPVADLLDTEIRSGPVSNMPKSPPLRAIYKCLNHIDRSPFQHIATAIALSIGGVLLLSIIMQRSRFLDTVIANSLISFLLVLAAVLFLRRRQNRQIEQAHHKLSVAMQETHQVLVQRLNLLEQAVKEKQETKRETE